MKHYLRYAEIYITNVCNFSCTHCQSFNNFAFKGHQKWEQYKNKYQALSERIDIGILQIMGGEPTTNPDFAQWVHGISELWPKSKLEISTNGSRLDCLDQTIYQTLAKHQGTLWFTCHDITTYNRLFEFSKNFLQQPQVDTWQTSLGRQYWTTIYNSIRESNWPDCERIEQFADLPPLIQSQFNEKLNLNSTINQTVPRTLIDENKVRVKLDWTQSFVSSAVEIIQSRATIKHNNDPEQAHNFCGFKTCHQINQGNLYKCPLVSVLPEFLKQFDVDIDPADRLLSDSYEPITGYEDDTTLANRIKDFALPIPQCKFCPVNGESHSFVGTDKKIKIKVVGTS